MMISDLRNNLALYERSRKRRRGKRERNDEFAKCVHKVARGCTYNLWIIEVHRRKHSKCEERIVHTMANKMKAN